MDVDWFVWADTTNGRPLARTIRSRATELERRLSCMSFMAVKPAFKSGSNRCLWRNTNFPFQESSCGNRMEDSPIMCLGEGEPRVHLEEALAYGLVFYPLVALPCG